MAEIYNCATATFIACSGENANCSLVSPAASIAASSFSLQAQDFEEWITDSQHLPSGNEVYQSILDSHHS